LNFFLLFSCPSCFHSVANFNSTRVAVFRSQRKLRLATRAYQNYDPKHDCTWKTTCPCNKMPPRILIIHNHNHINLKIKKTVLQTHQARKAELENLLIYTHQSLRQMQREWKQHKQEFHHGKRCTHVARCKYLESDTRFPFENEKEEQQEGNAQCEFLPLVPSAPPPYTRQNSGYESKETGH